MYLTALTHPSPHPGDAQAQAAEPPVFSQHPCLGLNYRSDFDVSVPSLRSVAPGTNIIVLWSPDNDKDPHQNHHCTVKMILSSLVSLLFGTAVLVHGKATNGTALQANPAHGRWVDAWASMPQLTEPANLPPAPFV